MNVLKHIESTLSARLLAAAALLSVANLTPAYADAGSAGSQHQADMGQKAQVTRAEAQRDPMLKERFDALDTNHDGVLDAEEIAAGNKSRGATKGTEEKR